MYICVFPRTEYVRHNSISHVDYIEFYQLYIPVLAQCIKTKCNSYRLSCPLTCQGLPAKTNYLSDFVKVKDSMTFIANSAVISQNFGYLRNTEV